MADNPKEDSAVVRQHLIDPEICIRCNTCEASCPIGAVTHDERNYVVKFDVCNACAACIAPCPTGAIDNWRHVAAAQAYTLQEQFSWDCLPAQDQRLSAGTAETSREAAQLAAAAQSHGGLSRAPLSAARARVNLFGVKNPAIATVSGNYRLTGPEASSDVRHIVLDFGATQFPVLEGQSVGIVPPGLDRTGKPHHVRLYSVASPRNGEHADHNDISLTVKRVTSDHAGNPVHAVASNYLCDLEIGARVNVVGPYGETFLMPNHPGASLLMICTGTGSAPMRAMTEWRRRRMASQEGGSLMLFFGARSPEELPYFGPLMQLPRSFIDVNLAFSRVAGQRKCYVQDLIRERSAEVARLLIDAGAYVYVCGLKGMEDGVEEAFREVCRSRDLAWEALRPQLLEQGRLHVETY